VALLLTALVAWPLMTVAASADPALYQGPDREARLLEGARKEGTLNLYTSLTVEDMAALNSAFESRYGVKVRMWRAAADKVLQRVLAEARAGRHEVDVVEASSPALESLHREGLLHPVHSPHHADLIEAAVPAHREWGGARLNVFVQAYNTQQVKKSDLPRAYADLADPRWKGKLGIEAADEDWFAALAGALGEKEAIELFRRVVAQNGMSVRKGHTLLTNLVASGEVPLALTVYNFTAEQTRRKGAPLDWFLIAPGVARVNGVAVPKRAPHPHAAILYYDFMLGGEGQKLLVERGFVPANRKLESPIAAHTLRIVEPRTILDESEKWSRIYQSVFAPASR